VLATVIIRLLSSIAMYSTTVNAAYMIGRLING
jgi:hypothetical protein